MVTRVKLPGTSERAKQLHTTSLVEYFRNHPDKFPPSKTQDYLAFVEPEQCPELTELLLKQGHSENVVRGVLGENFLRVAAQTWK